MRIAISDPAQKAYILAGALVFLGAVGFSAKAVLVKLAYRYEVDSVSLLALRMLFSLPFYLAIAWYAHRRPSAIFQAPSRRDLWIILLLGFVGYYLASLFDFMGLQYITASMERLILFVYPTLVVIISALLFRQKINRTQLMALCLTYLGILIAFSENLRMPEKGNFLLGAGLVFLSALTYGSYLVGSGRLLPRLGTWRFTSYAMTAAAVAVLLHHGLFFHFRLFHFPWQVYALSLLMALISTVLPSLLISEGIRLLGASNAAIIGSIGPISTILLARIFLDERLGPLQWLGTMVVIAGVLLITLRKNSKGS